jgi:hypothetical protein
MRLADAVPEAEIVEVGPRQFLTGRLWRSNTAGGKPEWSFVTEHGDRFLVANDPDGARNGYQGGVCAHSVVRCPMTSEHPLPSLWVLACGSVDILERWRSRRFV